MVQLRHIQADGSGIKGRRINTALTGCDIFCGPNGTGKTTALIAILATRGGLADADTDATRPYLGPDAIDSTLTSTWTVGGAERILHRPLGGSQKTKDTKAANTLAQDLMGGHVVRFDLADFATGGAAAREAILSGVLRVAGAGAEWTAETVRARLEKDAPDAVAELLKAQPVKGDLAAWFHASIEWARTEYTARNRKAKETKTEADAALKAEDVAVQGTLEGCRAVVAQLEERLGQVREQIAARSGAVGAEQERKAEGQRLALALDEAEQRHKGAVTRRDESANYAAALEKTAATLRPKLEQATAAEQAAVAIADEKADKRAEAQALVTSLRQSIASIEAQLAHVNTGVESACVHCGALDPLGNGVKLGALARDKASITFDLEDALDALAAADADLAPARAAALAAEAAAKATASEVEQNTNAIRAREAAVSQLAELVAQALAAKDRATKALAEWNERAQKRAEATQEEIGGTIEDLHAQRDALTAQLGDTRNPAEGTARALVEQHLAQRNREQARQEKVAAREAATKSFEAISQLGKALAALQTEVAASTYGGIEQAAQEILDEMGAGMVIEIKSASDIRATLGQAAWPEAGLKGPTSVSLWALSDSQAAMVGAALAVAFARLSGNPWRGLVLDKLETIQGWRLMGVLSGLAGMVRDGKLDNVAGALVCERIEDAPVCDGLSVHWTGGGEA